MVCSSTSHRARVHILPRLNIHTLTKQGVDRRPLTRFDESSTLRCEMARKNMYVQVGASRRRRRE